MVEREKEVISPNRTSPIATPVTKSKFDSLIIHPILPYYTITTRLPHSTLPKQNSSLDPSQPNHYRPFKQPDNIHICDGSDKENSMLLSLMTSNGMVRKLDAYENKFVQSCRLQCYKLYYLTIRPKYITIYPYNLTNI